jgi:hypothetical protein
MSTFVLILMLYYDRAVATVPGYHSVEECRAAGDSFMSQTAVYRHYVCIPGPVYKIPEK